MWERMSVTLSNISQNISVAEAEIGQEEIFFFFDMKKDYKSLSFLLHRTTQIVQRNYFKLLFF